MLLSAHSHVQGHRDGIWDVAVLPQGALMECQLVQFSLVLRQLADVGQHQVMRSLQNSGGG